MYFLVSNIIGLTPDRPYRRAPARAAAATPCR
jgi:hypothetical protein